MNDGDKALVTQEKVLIEVAKRDMEGIVPLYYEMKKAQDVILDADKTYTSLISAYKANIGIISNDITKIWNSENPNINAVKWLTMFNNFVIDYAKTLYLPVPPDYATEILKKYTKNKVPHFFKFAKDKEVSQVEPLNNSTVNKLYSMIPNKPIQFKKIGGKFDYRMLMSNSYPTPSEELVERFKELEKSKHSWLNNNQDTSDFHFNKMVRNELSSIHKSEDYIVNVLVEELYLNDSKFKNGLWDVYGDVIYKNLIESLKGTSSCENCNTRFEYEDSNEIYCNSCKKVIEKQKTKDRVKRFRESKKVTVAKTISC